MKRPLEIAVYTYLHKPTHCHYSILLIDFARYFFSCAEYARIQHADGLSMRTMLVNGELPGTPIVVYQGQQVRVDSHDFLDCNVYDALVVKYRIIHMIFIRG